MTIRELVDKLTDMIPDDEVLLSVGEHVDPRPLDKVDEGHCPGSVILSPDRRSTERLPLPSGPVGLNPLHLGREELDDAAARAREDEKFQQEFRDRVDALAGDARSVPETTDDLEAEQVPPDREGAWP